MKCVECGAEDAEATAICIHCGAPTVGVRTLQPEPAAGLGTVEETPPEPVGQRTGPGHLPRIVWAAFGLGLMLLVAVPMALGMRNSAPSSKSPTSQVLPLPYNDLTPGVCLTGSNLGLGTDSAWPDLVASVPCTRPHLAEVIFAGNAWPESLKKYPGDSTIYAEADVRCQDALTAYDGTAWWKSSFTWDEIVPSGRADWGSGDRSLVCVAYKGVPVNYSVKGSRR